MLSGGEFKHNLVCSSAQVHNERSDESYYLMRWANWKERVKQTPYEVLQKTIVKLQGWIDLTLDTYNRGKRSIDDTNLMIVNFTRQKNFIEKIVKMQEARAVLEIQRRF